jgi:DNA helicase MCM8
VDCELTEDLVDSCLPGDVVTVVGVVKAFKADGAPTSRDKNKSLFLLYVDAKSLAANDKVRKMLVRWMTLILLFAIIGLNV